MEIIREKRDGAKKSNPSQLLLILQSDTSHYCVLEGKKKEQVITVDKAGYIAFREGKERRGIYPGQDKEN